MATIKSYTDLSRSEVLAEILPIESADMLWEQHGAESYVTIKPWTTIGKSIGCHCLSCWSLAALLGVLPKGTNISTPKPINELGYCCWNQYDEIYADNPVDACYDVIIRLHELKML